MGDRVAVLKAGVLQQVDAPLALYDSPSNVFVAGFIGSPAMNLMSGRIVDGGVEVHEQFIPVPRAALDQASGNTVTVGIRPEAITVTADRGVPMDIALVEQIGADSYLYGTLAADAHDTSLNENRQVVARVTTPSPPRRGDRVRLSVENARIHVFDGHTGLRLSW